jgi:hypothetical protein
MKVIYRINSKFSNPPQEHSDLWGDYDEALGWFNGVKNNPDCVSMEMTKLQTSDDCSFFEEVEIVASYS